MISKFIEKDPGSVNLGTDIDEIAQKLFNLEMSTFNTHEHMASLTLHDDCITVEDESILPFRATKRAFDQWLQRARIPLSYAYDIPFDMLWYNLERRSMQYNRELLIRVRKHNSDIIKIGGEYDVIRAFLTDRYNPLQNTTCFSRFKEVICWASMSIYKALVSEDIFQVIANGEAKIDDDVATGIEMINGETGHRSLEINTVLKMKNTYLIISNSRESTKFNLKVTHLKTNIKEMMMNHSKKIIDSLDTFKTYVDAAKTNIVKPGNILDIKDKADIAVGRAKSREVLEDLQGKTKFEAARILAELGDELDDIEKQRILKMCAGKLIVY